MNVINLEEAPTNRSSCTTCGRQINKKDIRVVETYPTKFGHRNRYHCLNCGKDKILDMKENLNIVLTNINKFLIHTT